MIKKNIESTLPGIILPNLYLVFWSVPIDPGVWTPPSAPEMAGAYSPNNGLKSAALLCPLGAKTYSQCNLP